MESVSNRGRRSAPRPASAAALVLLTCAIFLQLAEAAVPTPAGEGASKKSKRS
jgi:hypothetical protein